MNYWKQCNRCSTVHREPALCPLCGCPEYGIRTMDSQLRFDIWYSRLRFFCFSRLKEVPPKDSKETRMRYSSGMPFWVIERKQNVMVKSKSGYRH